MTTITGIILVDQADEKFYNCLDSISNVTDRILLVTNRKGLVIPKYKILYINTNDYSELRNYACSHANTEWIFFLDSDEILSDRLIEWIKNLKASSGIDGYWIPRRNFISKDRYLKFGLFYPDYQLRLIRIKKEYQFKGKVHELICIPENKTSKASSDIYHFPRVPKYQSLNNLKNFKEYIALEADELMLAHYNPIKLLLSGAWKGLTLFFSGYFRGKGFLDGIAGLRAHLIFSSSIFLGYLEAAKRTLFNK